MVKWVCQRMWYFAILVRACSGVIFLSNRVNDCNKLLCIMVIWSMLIQFHTTSIFLINILDVNNSFLRSPDATIQFRTLKNYVWVFCCVWYIRKQCWGNSDCACIHCHFLLSLDLRYRWHDLVVVGLKTCLTLLFTCYLCDKTGE